MSEIASVPASFLNLDLELESSWDLEALAEELALGVFVLYRGPESERFKLSMEPLIGGSLNASPEACTEHFLNMLESLSSEGAAILKNCSSRVFDYGFDGGLEANPISTDLKSAHLARMVSLGIDLRITTYPYRAAEPEEWADATRGNMCG